MSALKSLYFRLICHNHNRNFQHFDEAIVRRICGIFRTSSYSEINIINEIYRELSNSTSSDLEIPEGVKALGQFTKAFVYVKAVKTHSRIVSFNINNNEYRCESSDLCFIVDYVIHTPES
jgi:hypothetical protein